MDWHPITVEDAINAHRAAVEIDEASFDENCAARDEKLAAVTWAAEQKAFHEFVIQPCVSAADVQAKLAYLTTGTIGQREKLLHCLMIEEYEGDDGVEAFVRSLVVSSAGQAEAVTAVSQVVNLAIPSQALVREEA